MPNKIELVVSTDPKKTGHLFCADCATELNVVLDYSKKIYRNPQWAADWDAVWHEYHSVRFIFPSLLRELFEFDGLKALTCPYCSYKGKITTMNNGLFDIRLIKNSLDADNAGGYKCSRCDGIFASQKCVTPLKEGLYICGDCAMYA
jgi:hypothetical protein